MFVDMDPQTDGSQFMLAEKLDGAATRFANEKRRLKHAKIRLGKDKDVAEREAIEEAKTTEPYGYMALIDRKHIPDNADGKKVRTVWESMENFRTFGAETTPKTIVPMEILAAKEGENGSLMLVAGHEEMTQMEGKIHAGEAASGGDPNVAWLTIPHHVLKQTAVENRCLCCSRAAGIALSYSLTRSTYWQVLSHHHRYQPVCGRTFASPFDAVRLLYHHGRTRPWVNECNPEVVRYAPRMVQNYREQYLPQGATQRRAYVCATSRTIPLPQESAQVPWHCAGQLEVDEEPSGARLQRRSLLQVQPRPFLRHAV
jgi:hypothetical protein